MKWMLLWSHLWRYWLKVSVLFLCSGTGMLLVGILPHRARNPALGFVATVWIVGFLYLALESLSDIHDAAGMTHAALGAVIGAAGLAVLSAMFLGILFFLHGLSTHPLW